MIGGTVSPTLDGCQTRASLASNDPSRIVLYAYGFLLACRDRGWRIQTNRLSEPGLSLVSLAHKLDTLGSGYLPLASKPYRKGTMPVLVKEIFILQYFSFETLRSRAA